MILVSLLGSPLAATHALLDIEGMDDDCCAQAVATALDALPFVDTAVASWSLGQACFAVTASVDEAVLRDTIEHLPEKYALRSVALVDACPTGMTTAAKDPWDGVEGIDLAIISRGEIVDVKAHLVPGRFTIVDYGASWCAPCHDAAAKIATYAKAHADVAVRAVLLGGSDATTSFAQPISAKELRHAVGLPWFVLHAPSGKAIYEGSDVDALIATMEKKRK